MDKINKIRSLFTADYSVVTLFDPVQTHAVRDIPNNKYSINEATRTLREHGAYKFRKVVSHGGATVTICFNANKMFED